MVAARAFDSSLAKHRIVPLRHSLPSTYLRGVPLLYTCDPCRQACHPLQSTESHWEDLAPNLEVKVGDGLAVFHFFCALAALRIRRFDQARSRFGSCAAAVDEERRRCLGL
jgi:hypothetical protein